MRGGVVLWLPMHTLFQQHLPKRKDVRRKNLFDQTGDVSQEKAGKTPSCHKPNLSSRITKGDLFRLPLYSCFEKGTFI